MNATAPLPGPCADAAALVSDALDGGLSPEQQERLDAHLDVCASCIARMQNTVTLRLALGGLGRREAQEVVAPLPAETVERLAAAVRRRVLASDEEQRHLRSS